MIRLGNPQFISVQGEGLRAGHLTLFTRFFGCNLRCKGFFQKDPTNSETFIDSLKGIDPKQYKCLDDLPVVEYGCDSIYSIDPRFKHLCTEFETVDDLVNDIYTILPGKSFQHPTSTQMIDWCLTGGEPLLQQDVIQEIFEKMVRTGRFPSHIQIETNGTQPLSPKFKTFIKNASSVTCFIWSISPKLFNVTGELNDKAWHPEYIENYYAVNPHGWLKFVVNNKEETWIELKQKVEQLTSNGVKFPIMIMPVGATKEQQGDSKIISKLADRAISEGYHISGRLHVNIWGNEICS